MKLNRTEGDFFGKEQFRGIAIPLSEVALQKNLGLESFVHSFKNADCDKAFFPGETWWLPATATPRCAPERLARAVLELHAGAADPAGAGKE